MKRTLPLLALACALAACTNDDTPSDKPATPAPPAAADSDDGQQASPGDTQLTIYSGGFDALAAGHAGGETGYTLVRRGLRGRVRRCVVIAGGECAREREQRQRSLHRAGLRRDLPAIIGRCP